MNKIDFLAIKTDKVLRNGSKKKLNFGDLKCLQLSDKRLGCKIGVL